MRSGQQIMYNPAKFAIEDEQLLFTLIEAHNFGTMVTHRGGIPEATHAPFMLDREGRRLISHVARANPQWRDFAENPLVLVVFQGPHAYVSPSWYTTAGNVPTWNYTAVHVYGRARVVDDEAEVRRTLSAIVANEEQHQPAPWSLAWDEPPYAGMTRGLVVFSVAIEQLQGKFKLNQNKTDADRAAAQAALARSRRPGDRAVAELMNDYYATRI